MKAISIVVLQLLVISVFTINTVTSQSIPIESMVGNERYFYQHSFFKELKTDSRFGFFHTSSMHIVYEEQGKNEMMSQSYLTYKITSFMKIAVGTFYATKPGFKISGALQFTFRERNLLFVMVPRVDLWKNSAYEIMSLLEYRPPISERISLYSRVQIMSNYGPIHHNRSYQNFRVGLGVQNLQFGLALNVDEYGREMRTHHNKGIFIRYELRN